MSPKKPPGILVVYIAGTGLEPATSGL